MANVLDLKNVPVAGSETGTTTDIATPVPPPDTQVVVTEQQLTDAILAGANVPTGVSWEAHHGLDSTARRRHYILLCILALSGALIAYLEASVLVFMTVLAGVAALEVRERWSRPVAVAIHQHGIDVDGHTYAHTDFASFEIHAMPDDTTELSLHTSRWNIPHLRLPLGSQDAQEVHTIMTQYVPQGRHRIPILDYLVRKRP